MAASDSNETLETLLNKATSPLNREDDWEYIMDFCDKVNLELEGVQTSTRLIVHKMQSPQEREALQALTVLEACVKNCGPSFHNELGKYRFLNELIKLVSPKYLGNKTSQKVQEKVISMLYTWSIALSDQVKIRDAYQMLKKQGVVTVDPKFNQSLISNIPSQKEDDRDTLFTDEEKRKQLEKLLKSTKPEDLQAANRLIKSVVKEDEAKMEKLKKRNTTLEEVTNNVRLLNEMLTHFNPDESSISDMQMMKELYDSCQKMRPTLFRLASDTDDEESALMDILRANDDVSRVMQSYEKLVQPKLTSMTDRKADGAANPQQNKQEPLKENNSSNLLDLTGLNLNAQAQSSASNSITNDAIKPISPPTQNNQSSNGLDDSLLLNFQSAPTTTSSNDVSNLFDDLLGTQPPSGGIPTYMTPPVQIPKLPSPPQPQPSKPPMFADIDVLSKDLMEKSLGNKVGSTFAEPSAKPTLNEMSKKTTMNSQNDTTALFDVTPPLTTAFPTTTLPQPDQFSAPPPSQAPFTTTASIHPTDLALPVSQTSAQDYSLNEIFVPLESIKPSTFPPITAYDKNGIRVMIHFAKEHAQPSRTDTLVSVVSILSTRTNPVQSILFQAAAPKVMKVKLQPPSNTELPAFNPIFSSPPLTQVMIIANPSQKDVKIRYKLDYKIDEQTSVSDNGLISGFPPAEQWGKL